MKKLTKRQKIIDDLIDVDKQYSVPEVCDIFAKIPRTRFMETVDIAVHLGIDSKRSDQGVRGVVSLPKGSGKVIKVAVLCQGEDVEKAKTAGADIVGGEEFIQTLSEGDFDFDLLISHPEMMSKLAKLGALLGPRGLMPNPRNGSVNADVAAAVTLAKAGQMQYRNDKAGIVHGTIGTVAFSAQDIQANVEALLSELQRAKPPEAKGVYLRKVHLSTTMGPGLRLDLASLGI